MLDRQHTSTAGGGPLRFGSLLVPSLREHSSLMSLSVSSGPGAVEPWSLGQAAWLALGPASCPRDAVAGPLRPSSPSATRRIARLCTGLVKLRHGQWRPKIGG